MARDTSSDRCCCSRAIRRTPGSCTRTRFSGPSPRWRPRSRRPSSCAAAEAGWSARCTATIATSCASASSPSRHTTVASTSAARRWPARRRARAPSCRSSCTEAPATPGAARSWAACAGSSSIPSGWPSRRTDRSSRRSRRPSSRRSPEGQRPSPELLRGMPEVEERGGLGREALVAGPPVEIVAGLLARDLLIERQRLLVRRPVGRLRLHLAVLARRARRRFRYLTLGEPRSVGRVVDRARRRALDQPHVELGQVVDVDHGPMVVAGSHGVCGSVLQRGPEEHGRDAAPGAAVDDARSHHDGADTVLGHVQRCLFVRGTPGDGTRRLERRALVRDTIGRALHPAAAGIDEGGADLAAKEIARAADGLPIEIRALWRPFLGDVHEGRPTPGGPGVSGGIAEIPDGELDASLLQGLSLRFRADEREHVVPGLLQGERDRRTDLTATAREEDLHARPSRMKRPVYAGRSGAPRANVTCVPIFAPPPLVRGDGWVYGLHAIRGSVENVSGL